MTASGNRRPGHHRTGAAVPRSDRHRDQTSQRLRLTNGSRAHALPRPQVAPAPADRERDEDDGVDEVVVGERVRRHARRAIGQVLGRGPLRDPHQRHHGRARDRGEPQRDTGGERQADTQQSEHEQPVRPGVPGPGVEGGLHRPDGDTTEEAQGRRAAVDPALAGRGRVTEPEGLVQERPQEDEPGQQSEPGEGVRAGGRRRLGRRLGGLLGRPAPVQGGEAESLVAVGVVVHGHDVHPFQGSGFVW